MNLINTLKLVQGAVSTQDLLPVLTHFAFYKGRICAFNGRLSIDAPLEECEHLSCTVPAATFVKAIESCEGEVPAITVTNEVLWIKAKNFTARMPIGTLENFPMRKETEGKMRALPGLLEMLQLLRPFIGNDASRPWASGILFREGIAAVTNNVVVAIANTTRKTAEEYILPIFAVEELLRIGHAPKTFTRDKTTVTYYLPGDVSLQTRLVDGEWPKSPITLIEELSAGAAFKKISPGLFAAVEQMVPFCADKKNPLILFDETIIHTIEGTVQGTVKGFKGLGKCKFRAEPLIEVLRIASEADFNKFPRVPWKATGVAVNVSGAIVGMMS